jgi:hypothetical protein
MCAGCVSASQDFDAKPFGSTNNGSMGDKGIAIKSDTKYDGDSGQGEKFEGMAPSAEVSAGQAQYTGRQ